MPLLVQAGQPELLVRLAHLHGIVDRRQSLPILGHLLLTKAGQQVDLLASDLEIQVRVATQLGVGQSKIATTIDARRLSEILKTMPGEGAVMLEQLKDRIVLRTADSRFTLQALNADDFPLTQLAPDLDEGFEVTQAALKKLLAKVGFAMALQDIRYYLNGTQLRIQGDQLIAAATDSHRLAVARTAVDGERDRRDVILPRKAVLELEKQLKAVDAPVRIRLAKNQARFEFGAVEFTTKLVEGKFPEWGRVLPQLQKRAVLAPRQRLMTALQRAAIVCNDGFKLVRLSVASGRMHVQALNAESEEVRDQVEVDHTGAAVEAGFNVYYLLDALSNLDADTVRIDFTEEGSTALITEPGSDAVQHVVMPMRLE